AAESGLERAQLAVGKTSLSLPWNALVQQRAVDVGQLVTPGTPLATLVGTDEFWVQVSVPVDRLRWIDIPGVGGATVGSTATVRQLTAGAPIVRTGRVVRLMGDLDPAGRMARLLVTVEDPLGLAAASGSAEALPLLIGAYVEVEIVGDELADVIEVPRVALHDGDTVYVDAGGSLAVRTVEVAWRRRDSVLVSSGLAAGERVVVSPLSGATPGMVLRTIASAARDAGSAGAATGRGATGSGAAGAEATP
ncbi:MAG: HlyD family efflux transporter periplasmic adaptor subunit, partial [Kofleriaceae bacterium]